MRRAPRRRLADTSRYTTAYSAGSIPASPSPWARGRTAASAGRALGQRPLAGFAAAQGLVNDDVGAVAEELLSAGEQLLDVGARQVRVDQLAGLPALDEREPPRVVDALMKRVQDATVLAVGGLGAGTVRPRQSRPPCPAER